MEIYQAQYFLALSEERDFARAPLRCGVSPPSLSIGIQRLEAELGGLLFACHGKTIALSSLGQDVLPLVEKFYGQTFDFWQGLERLKRSLQRKAERCRTARG
jgi:DNA-binding transcriptional LysR family regulator